MWSITILSALIALTSDIEQELDTFQAKLRDYHLSWAEENFREYFSIKIPSDQEKIFYRNNRIYNIIGYTWGYPKSVVACKHRETKVWRLKKQDDLEYLYGQVLESVSEAEGIWVYTQYLDNKRDNGSIVIYTDGYIVNED